MATEQPTEGRCNAKAWLNEEEREDPDASKSGFCESYPVDGSSTCRMHFGTVDERPGAPEGNQNPKTHGIYSDELNLYNHLTDEEKGFIDDIAKGYLEYAPFGPEHPLTERLYRTCTMMYQEWKAAGKVESVGPSENRKVAVGETVVYRDEEHHLSRRELSLNTKVRDSLQKLGCLPGATGVPGGSKGDTIAQVFEAAVRQISEQNADAEHVDSEQVDV